MAQRALYDDNIPAISFLPSYQFVSTAQASGAINATSVSGAAECYITQSGATALTTPTAAQIVAAIQNVLSNLGLGPFPPLGYPLTYFVRVINTNAGTLTIAGGTGVTMLGTATLATATSRDFIVTVTGLNTATFQSAGTGTTS